MIVGAGTRSRVFIRSLAIQGSWNYRTLIGTGFAFALLPILRILYRDDPRALQDAVNRHRGIFNSHPYLVGVALGAVARLEMEGADADTVERFKAALRGPLGALGDRLVWAGWRPLCLILSLVLYYAGLHWAWALLVFLIVYNLGHFALRAWGFSIGFRHGREVGDQLRRARLADPHQSLVRIGAFSLGILVPLLLGSAAAGLSWPWWLAASAAAVLGMGLGNRIRTPLAWALIVFVIASVTFGGIWNG